MEAGGWGLGFQTKFLALMRYERTFEDELEGMIVVSWTPG